MSLKKKRLQQGVFTIFSLFVTVSIFAYLFSHISLADLKQIFLNVSWRGLTAFFICSFMMSFFRTWRYAVLLQANSQAPSMTALFLVTVVRNFFSDLLPARLGTLVYIYLVKSRLGIPFGAATASFAMSFVFDILALAFLIILAAAFVSVTLLSTPVIIGGGVILTLASGLVLLSLPRLLYIAGLSCQHLPFVGADNRLQLQQAMYSARDGILEMQQARIFSKILALSFGVRCFKYLCLYTLLLALLVPAGYEAAGLGLPKVFLGLCSAELAASLPISGIAGFGAYEGAWTLVFQLLGYPAKMAMVSGVSHHLFTQVYGYSIGGIALLILWLPLFHEKRKRRMPNLPGKSKFWLHFSILFAAGFIVVAAAYPETLAWLHGREPSSPTISKTQEHAQKEQSVLSLVRGWVVYHRPDGIYKIKIGETKEHQLAPFGTAPRWSPDGQHIVFVHRNDIMHMQANGKKLRKIAETNKGKAVCYHPSNKAVLFTDNKYIRQVDLRSGRIDTLAKGHEFREIDISQDGKSMAVSVRTPWGFQVRLIDLASGERKKVASGCSASLSPDLKYITVNGRGHRFLDLYSIDTLSKVGRVSAPEKKRFDNQFWSNHSHWLVSKSEDDEENIYIHHLPSDRSFQVTVSGHCDRPDFFVSRSK